jgi:hypothetical protein
MTDEKRPHDDADKKPPTSADSDKRPPGELGEHAPGSAPGVKENRPSLERPNIQHSGSPASHGAAAAEDRESLKSERSKRRKGKQRHEKATPQQP